MTAWFACTPVDDLVGGTRYFQQEPCAEGYAHAPLPPGAPDVPLLRDAPAPYLPGSPATPGATVYRWHWHDRGFAGNPARSHFSRGRRR